MIERGGRRGRGNTKDGGKEEGTDDKGGGLKD